MIHASAVVLRGGKETEVPIAEIAPGDIVALSAGSIVPADMARHRGQGLFRRPGGPDRRVPARREGRDDRLGRSGHLRHEERLFPRQHGDLGTARGIAVNTGMRTFLGSVAADLSEPKESPTSTKAPRPS